MHVTKWSQYYWPVGYINQVVVPSVHRNLNVAVHIVLTSPELSALFNKTHNPKRKDFLHTPTLLHTHTHTHKQYCVENCSHQQLIQKVIQESWNVKKIEEHYNQFYLLAVLPDKIHSSGSGCIFNKT